MVFKDIQLFESLLEISLGSLTVDLHNDYTCIDLDYSSETLNLVFQKDQNQDKLVIAFDNVYINKLSIPLKTPKGLILDNFHRGRYEEAGKLYDIYNEKICLYLEFLEQGMIELLCTKVQLLEV